MSSIPPQTVNVSSLHNHHILNGLHFRFLRDSSLVRFPSVPVGTACALLFTSYSPLFLFAVEAVSHWRLTNHQGLLSFWFQFSASVSLCGRRTLDDVDGTINFPRGSHRAWPFFCGLPRCPSFWSST
jgi:hypothetical protein